jgi:hypothetical protein
LLYQVVRFEPKAFFQRRPDGKGGWIWNLQGVEPVLYHLPRVAGAISAGQTVYICEGEKDADNLHLIGLCGTTSPMGAGKWRDTYSQALQGATVVILPDQDEPGRNHAARVVRSLNSKAKSIKVIDLPGPGKDISDWLESGGTGEQLLRIVAETPQADVQQPGAPEHFQLTSLSDLLKEPDEEIAYIWENTLIKGGLSILVAKPKVGKSTLARNLALAVARGDPAFMDRTIVDSGPVVYLALEEKRSEVKRHFVRMGATADLPIFIHTGSAPEQAIEELRKAIIRSQAHLAIVDPLQRLVRIRDLNDYSAVSLGLEPLLQIARETGCHLLLIHHATKGIARDGGDGILGSTAIFGSVDCALIMKRTESHRTIESIQRYGEDMPRIVLKFDAVTGLTGSGGTLAEAEETECEEAILELLSDHEMAEKEIKEGISDHKGGMVSKILRLLCQEGRIRRQGQGKKGAPYIYTLVSAPYQDAGDVGDSGDKHVEIPSIPTIFNQVCLPLKNAGDKNDDLDQNSAAVPKTGAPPDLREAILGMPVDEVIASWRAAGAPAIPLVPGENCTSLDVLLSHPDCKERDLKAVRSWLDTLPPTDLFLEK